MCIVVMVGQENLGPPVVPVFQFRDSVPETIDAQTQAFLRVCAGNDLGCIIQPV